MLLLPAQAGVDGDELVERPCVLSKQRVVIALRLEIQQAEFATGLAEEDSCSTVAAAIETRNEEFRRAAESVVDPQLEGRIRSIRDQLVLQVSVAGQNGSRCCRIDRDIRTGAEFRAVIVRAGIAITHGGIVCAQEVERLRGIEVKAVVVPLGILEEAQPLAAKRP